MGQNERALKAMSIGDILDYSIEVYKRNFKKLTVLALIFYVPVMLLYTGVVSFFYRDMMGLADLNTGFDELENSELAIYRFLAYYLILVGLGLFYFVYSFTLRPIMDASIIRVVYNDVVTGKGSPLKETIKRSFKKFWPLMGNRLLYSLIIAGISFGVFLVVYILMFAMILSSMAFFTAGGPGSTSGYSTAGNTAGIVALVIGIILFVLGILLLIAYFAVRFNYGTHAVTLDNSTATGALSRSWGLSNKKFWHLAISYGLGWILVSLIPQMLAGGAYALMLVNKDLSVVGSILAQVIQAVITPFLMTVTTLQFINLKIMKEGLDLELKVGELLEEQERKDAVLYGEGLADA